MIPKIKKLTVKYNGAIVGYLVELNDLSIAFQYDDMWLKKGFSISPISLPLEKQIFVSPSITFEGLYGVFWDSLPDGWGIFLMEKSLAKKGINFNRLSPLQKLALVSENGLGGLSYEPSVLDDGANSSDVDLDELSRDIRQILEPNGECNRIDELYKLGGSSGGSRPKAHLRIDDAEWIIKFPRSSDSLDVGKEEFEANSLAKECGLNTNEYKLFPSKVCSGYFGSKRFDISHNRKIHMISLCALLETSHRTPLFDYSHLFQVINMISVNKRDDLYEAFRRMCFNVYFQNKDDHGKNFAFLYDEASNGYVLSPAYDITSTPEVSEHEMTINGKGNPNDEDLLFLAKKFNLSLTKCKQIMALIKNKI